MSDRPVPHVWQALLGTNWAMLPEKLHAVFEIAARENLDIEAVAEKLGRSLDNTRAATMRDGVASIPIVGAIFPRASLFAAISGGVSADDIAIDLRAALDNPAVHSILLEVDSGGGDVNGIAEVAAMIRAANAQKPVVVYGRDLVASAAYWLAAAAGEVVIASTAMVGSIGIIGTVGDPTKQTSKSVEFVSSQSPHKRPDPNSQAGGARIQARVDEVAAIFIADVARYRGVSVERVAADFGQGDVLVGAAAVKAGLADRLGSYEGVIAELQARAREPRRMMGGRLAATQEGTMTNEQPKRGRADRFFAWLAGEGDESAFAGANIAADGGPSTPVVATATTAGVLPVTLASAPDPEKEAMRAELARLRAGAREGIPASAAAFAESEIRASRALPAEHDALVGAYTEAAEDDAAYPREGQPTRVARLQERQATRPAHGLTREVVPIRAGADGALTLVAAQETTRAEGAAEPLSPEKYRTTLAFTATGKGILAAHGIPAIGAMTAEQRAAVVALMAQQGLTAAS